MSSQLDVQASTDQLGLKTGFRSTAVAANLTYRHIPNPFPEPGACFGIAVSAAGERTIVGAHFAFGPHSQGAAHIFEGTTRIHTTVNPHYEGFFGVSVANLGNKAIVGASYAPVRNVERAGAVYVIDPSSDDILLTIDNPHAHSGDWFGFAVAVVGDKILVGAPYDNPGSPLGLGAAYLFDGTTGELLEEITSPDPEPGEQFGFSVAASDTRLVIGAPGSNGSGSIYSFTTAGSLERSIQNPDPDPLDLFGSAVALVSGDILVGAYGDDPGGVPQAGSAYLFDGGTGTQKLHIPNPEPVENDDFGLAVAGSGDDLVIGAPFDAHNGFEDPGSAYVVSRNTGATLHVLHNPDPGDDDHFGDSVAIDSGRIVIGAPFDLSSGNFHSGSVYFYYLVEPPTPSPSPSPSPTPSPSPMPTPIAVGGTVDLVSGGQGGGPSSALANAGAIVALLSIGTAFAVSRRIISR